MFILHDSVRMMISCLEKRKKNRTGLDRLKDSGSAIGKNKK